ncbi:MAG: protease pro-enzyme activation domain-containing protein, partial [Thermoplasmata archaeon]
MRTSVVLLAAVVVVVSLLATGVRAAPAVSTVPAPVIGSVGLTSDAVPVPMGAPTTPLSPGSPVELSLTLTYPHPAALSDFLSQIEDPSSPLYRGYLTHAEFESTFAPAPSAVATVAGVLASHGARDVTAAPDRLSVSGQLAASEVDSLFGVQLVRIGGADGDRLFTAVGTPSVPGPLEGLVSGVSGLSNAADLRLTLNLAAGPVARAPTPGEGNQFVVNNTTGVPWFVGSDFSQAFRVPELLPGNSSVVNASYPTGVAIATLLASGYNVSGANPVANTPPWDPSVIKAYFNDTLPSNWPHSNLTGVPVLVAGITPPLPGTFGSVNDSSLDEFENSLDLEMAGSMAPGAPLFNFYFAGSLLYNAVSDADVASYFDQDLASALSYNY